MKFENHIPCFPFKLCELNWTVQIVLFLLAYYLKLTCIIKLSLCIGCLKYKNSILYEGRINQRTNILFDTMLSKAILY